MAHINKQIVELKHQMERTKLLQLEKQSLKNQLENKLAEIEKMRSRVNASEESKHNYRLSIASLVSNFRKKKEDQAIKEILDLKQKENDLSVLQAEYDRVVEELKAQGSFDKQYFKLMQEKKLQATHQDNEVLEQLEMVIEKCRLENKRINDAQHLGEKALALIHEVFDGCFSSTQKHLFESSLTKGSKQFERLNAMQELIAQLKRTLDQFEAAYDRCPKLNESVLEIDFVPIADQIVDNFLMDYFFEDEVITLKKQIMKIKKQIVDALHDLDIQLRMNQNKIIEMLDCINAVGERNE